MIKGEYKGASLGTLVVILVALVALAALSGSDNSSGSPRGGLALDGPLVRSTAPLDQHGSDAAEITGVVALVDGCVLLADPFDGRTTAVVWPNRTQWDAASETIELPNGDVVGIGDEVWGGGGFSRPGADDTVEAEELRRCVRVADSAEVAGVNASTDGIRAGGPP